ncbi:hypothetical protein QBC46DRAFT_379076 [Diplogelasinospora grovesii]|uniref:Uncharacterized protein n=1 Tax=Diplogelasinospora grovesii TaxID=303347 RepID=A0AAN6NCH7_9PEZI|nr:hypothetical protein QBC46DRAFT_379076 [Diplogelasinospora grovesii]
MSLYKSTGGTGRFQDFAFIHVSHPDDIKERHTQRAVRRGAMAQTAASRRKRPPKPPTVPLHVPSQLPSLLPSSTGSINSPVPLHTTSTPVTPVTPNKDDVEAMSRWLETSMLWRTLPDTTAYPIIQPDTRARELFYFMHGESASIYRPSSFRLEWFAMAMLDQSAYYLSLANAALILNLRRKNLTASCGFEYSEYPESSKYYHICLSQVTRRLGDVMEGVSKGMVTTVLGFICHDSSIGNWTRWKLHMDGLERIIKLRGGLQGLGMAVPLFVFWFDVTGSAVFDTPPRFPIPSQLPQTDITRREGLSQPVRDLLSRLRAAGLNDVSEALIKVMAVANYVNQHACPEFWSDGLGATKLIGPAAHYILSLPRLFNDRTTQPGQVIREMVRLVSLVLLARLKKAFFLITDELNCLTERFRTLSGRMEGVALFPEVRIWAHLIVAVSAEEGGIIILSEAGKKEVRRALGQLDIRTGLEGVEVAKGITWIDAFVTSDMEGRIAAEIDHST